MTAPKNPKPFDAHQAIVDLRAAIRALDGATNSVHTVKANEARQVALQAYVNSLNDEERALVVAHAQKLNPEITDYYDALAYRGTSLITELRDAGAIK